MTFGLAIDRLSHGSALDAGMCFLEEYYARRSNREASAIKSG